MALKSVIDKIEDVPEALRDHYVEKDGKWMLQVEGGKSQADVDKVLAAKQKEVTEHAATKALLKTATDKLSAFGELDPDDVHTKLEKLTTLEASGANPKADEITRLIETGVQNRLKQETTKLQRQLETVTTERDTAVAQVGGLNTQITQRGIDDAIRSAATAAKVLPEAVLDLTLLARNDFKLVDGKVVTEDGRDPVQWLEDRKKTAPYLWPVAKGAGGQGGGDNNLTAKDNPFSADGWNMTKQGQVVKENPTKAAQLAQAAGTTVGGPRPAAAKK